MGKGNCFIFKATVSRPNPGLSTVGLKVKQVPFATAYTWPPDDRLQMGPKQVEAW
jgi:hypothetical protein